MQVFEDTLPPQTQELWGEWPARGCITTEHHPKDAARPTSPIAPHQQKLLLDAHRHGAALTWASTTAYGHPKLCQETWSGQSPGNGAFSPEKPSWWWIKPQHSPCAQTAFEQVLGHTDEVDCVLSWSSNSGMAQGLSYQKRLWKMLESSWKAERGMDLGKRGRGRLTGRQIFSHSLSVAFGWDSSALCLSAAFTASSPHPQQLTRC